MMSGILLDRATGPLAGLARQAQQWWHAWYRAPRAQRQAANERLRSAERMRFHLGRGRLARDAGRFEDAVRDARQALLVNPQSAWALALLGQCLTRQRQPELRRARQALERAQALDPTNGYFVRLLLDVLEAEGDERGRADVLAWAWWHGAPVERWLPDGPPTRRTASAHEASDVGRLGRAPAGPADGVPARDGSRGAARESVLAGR